jgi:hypothetical protein
MNYQIPEERLLDLIDKYVAITYPNAIKVEIAPPGGNVSITSLLKNLEDAENGDADEDDVLIHKMDAYGMANININKEFLGLVKSMFGGKKNIKGILEKWFDNKPVDMDLLGSSKQEQNENVSERQRFDFQQLVDSGVLWITQPHVNGQRVEPNWKGDSNVITLWNIEHPEEGQEWVHDAIKHPKPEAIEWWTQEGQDTLSDAKYRQILRSIKLVDSQSKDEFTEGEITERCWKGYTQKGMKTMFGKRYPNCVKIKKKRSVNESKMMDYLKQFLSGEVLDNYRKEKGRKEFQKMVDMVYKITAKDNQIEGMVGVLVGNIEKSIWGHNFNDEKSVGSRWDFTVTLKPLFTNYNPNNESDYDERVLKFENEFTMNARGMGFEMISPIQHEKVKNYRVKFEWASRLDVVQID